MATPAERALRVREVLDEYVPETPVPLTHRDPYTLLIAVLLSARCTDKRVNEVTPKLFALASDPKHMATLPEEAIRNVIRPCGLSPTKATRIRALSAILVARYGGKVPDDIEQLESLPGVGHKTASVVMTQCFGIPAFPVDTHIRRCAVRWGLSTGKTVRKIENDLKALFPEESWGRLHLQIIYFARKFCPARGHDRTRCPMCRKLSEP